MAIEKLDGYVGVLETLLLSNSRVVHADNFPLRNSLEPQSEDRGVEITPCDSQRERMLIMTMALLDQGQSAEGKEQKPSVIVADEDPKDLIQAAETLSNDSLTFKKIAAGITIIQRNALSHTDTINPVTNIRIVTLPPNAMKFTTHPTPSS